MHSATIKIIGTPVRLRHNYVRTHRCVLLTVMEIGDVHLHTKYKNKFKNLCIGLVHKFVKINSIIKLSGKCFQTLFYYINIST